MWVTKNGAQEISYGYMPKISTKSAMHLVNVWKKVFMADDLIPLFKMFVGWPNIVKLWHNFELYM